MTRKVTAGSFVLIGLLVCLSLTRAYSADEKALVITVVGKLDTNLLNRVADFVGENCGCRVRVSPFAGPLLPTPQAEAEQMRKLLPTNDVLLLALINVPEEIKFRSGTFKSLNVAILNTWALRPASVDSEKDREQYARRILKESMNAIGALIGHGACPNPTCAMSLWESAQELDAKGCNYCPPCDLVVRKLLIEQGVVLPEQ